jgi:hypothetical protein
MAGHAATAGGPLTVFWGGLVDGLRLRAFVADAAAMLAENGAPRHNFSTTMLTDDDEIHVTSEKVPLWPLDIAAKVGFVRFDCGLTSPCAGRTSEDASFAAWARLDQPSKEEIDAIGVFGAPTDIRLLRRHIAQLISETAHSDLDPGFVSDILARVEADLAKE